jgi:DNA-binding NarL/FixJ family response regulator
MIRLLIADDHTLVRESLAQILGYEEDIEIIGLARDGAEAIAMATRLHPDVALVDLNMPGVDGLEATRRIRAVSPNTHIALLTGLDSEEALFQGLLAGVEAYVLKESGRPELLKAIRRLNEGDTHFGGESLRRLVGEIRRLNQFSARCDEAPPEALSDREREVLRLVVQGRSNKEIAHRIGVEISTVKSHLHNAFEKIGVQDRTQAAVLCLERGWFRGSPTFDAQSALTAV